MLTEALAISGIPPNQRNRRRVWLINSNITSPTIEDMYNFAHKVCRASANEGLEEEGELLRR